MTPSLKDLDDGSPQTSTQSESKKKVKSFFSSTAKFLKNMVQNPLKSNGDGKKGTYSMECTECGYEGDWVKTSKGIHCPRCNNNIDMYTDHPEQIMKDIYQTKENMTYHLMKFMERKDWSEKWEDCLVSIKESDLENKEKKKFKQAFKEVFDL